MTPLDERIFPLVSPGTRRVRYPAHGGTGCRLLGRGRRIPHLGSAPFHAKGVGHGLGGWPAAAIARKKSWKSARHEFHVLAICDLRRRCLLRLLSSVGQE